MTYRKAVRYITIVLFIILVLMALINPGSVNPISFAAAFMATMLVLLKTKQS